MTKFNISMIKYTCKYIKGSAAEIHTLA